MGDESELRDPAEGGEDHYLGQQLDATDLYPSVNDGLDINEPEAVKRGKIGGIEELICIIIKP